MSVDILVERRHIGKLQNYSDSLGHFANERWRVLSSCNGRGLHPQVLHDMDDELLCIANDRLVYTEMIRSLKQGDRIQLLNHDNRKIMQTQSPSDFLIGSEKFKDLLYAMYGRLRKYRLDFLLPQFLENSEGLSIETLKAIEKDQVILVPQGCKSRI